MNALQYIIDRYNLDINSELPIKIPDIGRDVLPGWLHHLNFKKGVEIGVASGEFSLQLIRANPQMKLIGIDPYLPYSEYKDYSLMATFEKLESDALEKLSKIHNYEFMKEMSMDAIKKFEDESLDFCYIDGNHQDPYVTQDIENWPSKVRSGGIIAGHDYAKISRVNWSVKEAIHKYTKDNNIKPWFILGADGRIKGTTRDGSRSWMFIKP
jgi:predicted O-methyltransferase YrrM